MEHDASLARLKVGDEGFLVSSLIERCPRVMMLRELVRNALEAAATAPVASQRSVEIDSISIDGVPKLRIRNGGRGMDASELFRMADLAASVRKQQGLDRNFGMGAKVASLPSNRLGLRYRSCHDGVVRETMLGWRDGAYGRVLQQAGGEGPQPVVERGRGLPDPDWTEVVLFGNRSEQRTDLDPYDGAPAMPPGWVAQELAARFFRIDHGLHIIANQSGFEPWSARLPRTAARYDSVRLADGVLLHYAHCPRTNGDAVPALAGLVHRGEFYDLRRGEEWLYMAPVFGIPFAAGVVCLVVELPDDHPVVPDGYRQFLRRTDGRQEALLVRDFAPVLHANRPGWLLALIDGAAPDATVRESVYGELDRLLRLLGVRRRARSVANNRVTLSALSDGNKEPAGEAPPAFEHEPVPEMLLLRAPGDIAARGLVGRAGRYYPETHQLFLNALDPSVLALREALEREFANLPDQARVRAACLEQAEQAMAGRVGRMLVFALAKQGHWPDGDVAQALSPHALSLAADDWRADLAVARVSLGRQLAMGNESYPALAD